MRLWNMTPILQMRKLKLSVITKVTQIISSKTHNPILWSECLCFLPPSLKFIYWSPNLQCDGVSRRGLWKVIRFRWSHEGRTPWWHYCPYKKTCQSLLSPPYNKKFAICKPGRGPSPKPNHAGILISDSPASRTVRNKCLSFKSLSLWYFVLAAQAKTSRMA